MQRGFVQHGHGFYPEQRRVGVIDIILDLNLVM
jgi:hypothetical protein